MIETFTRKQFEQALPTHKETSEPLWEYAGLLKGEHVYRIPIPDTNKRIMIRSSVRRNGISADTGDDSIRLWVQYHYRKIDKWIPLGKLDAWTTRKPGWQDRMTNKLRRLWQLALEDSAEQDRVVAKSLPVNPDTNTKSTPSERQTKMPNTKTSNNENPEPASEQSICILNTQQLAAIEAPIDACVRILAGPGSGKTLVLEYRYANLLANGAEPADILAVTFSKPMANELLRRILIRSPQAHGTAAEQQICTIHAICYRMLRADGDVRKVAKDWRIKKTLQRIAEELWPYADDRPGWKEMLAFINTAKNHGLASTDDLKFFNRVHDVNGRNVGRELHEARRRLDDHLRQSSFLTFSDMLLDVEIKLNRDRAFREKWQNRFKWTLVDEGQDTNAQAMRILTTLAEPQNRFFIVGDMDQLLYRFTGATPEANLFEGFEERYPDGKLILMGINYRSTKVIIETQLRLIRHNYTSYGGPYETKYLKPLEPHQDALQGEPITYNEFDTPDEEARALAGNLVEALANGRQHGDFFIGARTRAQLGYLEGPLVRAKIPFINITGGSFWASKHVADVIAYMRLAHDVSDDVAFKRVFNIASNWMAVPWRKSPQYGEYCHHRYLGRAFLEACDYGYINIRRAANRRSSFGPGVQDLEDFVLELQAELARAESPAEIIKYIVENCYCKYLRAEEGLAGSDEAENGKLEDLTTVSDVATQFSEVQDFLDYVDEAVRAAEAARDKEWANYVILSTVHRLKGQEREVVYGVGLSEGTNLLSGRPAGLLPHTFSLADPPQLGILPTGGRGRLEDERCVAFVLISRARSEVHLSGVRTYRTAQMETSRFVDEMGLSERYDESRHD